MTERRPTSTPIARAEHASGFYSDDLVIAVPKNEYLFKTTSSLLEAAKRAARSARSDSDNLRRRSVFSSKGTAIN